MAGGSSRNVEPKLDINSDPAKRRQRKRHSKSRKGCLNCKKLRVKCDETRPNCLNCLKREKQCIYLSIGSNAEYLKSDDGNSAFSNVDPNMSSTPTSSVSPLESASLVTQAATQPPSSARVLQTNSETRQFPVIVSSSGNEIGGLVAPVPAGTEQGGSSSGPSSWSVERKYIESSTGGKSDEHSSKMIQDEDHDSGTSDLQSDTSIVLSSQSSQGLEEQHSHISKSPNSRENNSPVLNVRSPFNTQLMPPSSNMLSQNEYQLLDHYNNRAGRFIMTAGENNLKLWQNYVPTIVFTSPAVKDSLLGVTALDLTRQTQGNLNYSTYARKMFIQCVKNFTSGINNTAESNFITSCFLMIMAFDLPDLIPLLDEKRLDLMEVISGPGIISENVVQALMNRWVPVLSSHLQPRIESAMTEKPEEIGSLKYLLNVTAALDENNLLQHDKLQLKSPNASEQLPEQKYLGNHRKIYDTAIQLMHDTFLVGVQYNNPIRMFYYLMHLCKDLCALARKRYAYALVVMVFMLACLIPVQDFMWVNQRCRSEVQNLVNLLGYEWRDLLAWPISLAIQNPSSLEALADPNNQIYPKIDITKLLAASKSERYVQRVFVEKWSSDSIILESP